MQHITLARYRVTHLHSVLRKQGRSAAWLASELGVSRSFINKVMHGERTISAEHVDQVSRLVQVPAELLFRMSDDTVDAPQDTPR